MLSDENKAALTALNDLLENLVALKTGPIQSNKSIPWWGILVYTEAEGDLLISSFDGSHLIANFIRSAWYTPEETRIRICETGDLNNPEVRDHRDEIIRRQVLLADQFNRCKVPGMNTVNFLMDHPFYSGRYEQNTETLKPEPVKEKTEHERLMDFFFPKDNSSSDGKLHCPYASREFL